VTSEIPGEILAIRASIDNIDAALVHLLAERFKMTRRVGEIKAVTAMPPADPSRDAAQIERLTSIATEAGLDPAFAEAFRAFIVAEVIRHHKLIAADYAASGHAADLPPLDTFA
jgi:chorismate mutase